MIYFCLHDMLMEHRGWSKNIVKKERNIAMKRKTFALLFCAVLVVSCLFASCNANQKIFEESSSDNDLKDSSSLSSYDALIKDLENQILLLQQNQTLNDSKNQQELERLQQMLEQLKNENSNPPEENQGTDSTKPDPNDKNDKEEEGDDTQEGNEPEDSDKKEETDDNKNQQNTVGKFLYTVNGNQATITGYTGEEDTLIIPSVIDGYSVVSIADNAFEGAKIKKLVISSGIVKIGWFSFQNCPFLSSVTLPTSIEQIGYSAFSGASSSLTFYAASGSFALQYAQSYGFSYVTV